MPSSHLSGARLLLACVLLLLGGRAAQSAAAPAVQNFSLAGYTFLTDVTGRTLIDVDYASFMLAARAFNFTRAKAIYAGSGSVASATFADFSLDAPDQFAGESMYAMYSTYYGSATYANDFVMGALNGTGAFASATSQVRAEAAIKGALLLNLWMQVIHEMSESVGNCGSGAVFSDDDPDQPHALPWDEAWALYAGSMANTAGSNLLHGLALAMCVPFGTCDDVTTHPHAVANDQVLFAFSGGQTMLVQLDCDEAASAVNVVATQMQAVLMQNLLLAIYQADPASPYTGRVGKREAAQAYAVAQAALPLLSDCSPAVAQMVKEDTDINSAHPYGLHGFVVLTKAVQATFSCLGVTCVMVGGVGTQIPMCNDLSGATGNATLAGYTFATDMSTRVTLDLDMASFQTLLRNNRFADALVLYQVGALCAETMQGFSLQAADTMAADELFNRYSKYFKSVTYADDFVTSALNGDGIFFNRTALERQEAAKRGVLVLNLFMQIAHEMSESVANCENGKIYADDDPDHATALPWDEAWAFYAGTLADTTASNLMHGFAFQLCQAFNTCDNPDTRPHAVVNDQALYAFVGGQAMVLQMDCDEADDARLAVLAQMNVALLQSLVLAIYRADPKSTYQGTRTGAEQAAAYTQAQALLPQLAYCNADVAKMVHDETLLNNTKPYSTYGYVKLINAVQSTFPCMQVKCTWVGTPSTDVPVCDDAALTQTATVCTSALSGGQVAGIVIGVLLAFILAAGAAYRRGKKAGQDKSQAGFGHAPKAKDFHKPQHSASMHEQIEVV